MFTQGFSVYYSPLDRLETRAQGVITAIRHQDDRIINKLLSMGIYKGMSITLEQKFPAFIVKVGQTRLALDSNIASSIKVKVTQNH